ncbi:TonB-dependent receptor [Flavobacteriaceae bacterium]|nr:TonB-dependent receptor [Flavobacteriaceae bacterium]
MKGLYLFIASIICSASLCAQLDSIQHLNEVVLVDSKLEEFSEGYTLTKISDTVISRNPVSLSDLLNFNSNIYIKENGYGMVASPSFRGTNASQTAVIWNGIPINSNLTGQTDFNTIATASLTNVIIRSGGGSSQYGSGAVGGSIHLNNTIEFTENSSNELTIYYGSYASVGGIFKRKMAAEKKYLDMAVDFISSDNDYEYVGLNRKNNNGEFNKLNISMNGGLRLNNSSLIWNSNYFSGVRNLSGTITTFNKDSYKDETFRNLLTWNSTSKKWNNIIKGAHIFERYQYYPNRENVLYFEGKSNTIIGDYQLEYKINEKITVSSILNLTHIKAKGANIGDESRNTLAAIFIWKQLVSDQLSYNINIRQEFLNDFENPLIVSIDTKYKINQWYSLKANASKNYRVPTFNDLYWNNGGNVDLKPEISYQGAISNEFYFKYFLFNMNLFYINSKDLISWQPDINGMFSPINISETENIGFEMAAKFSKSIQKNIFNIGINYAYTSAKNIETGKQLMYVPFHKVTGTIDYRIQRFNAYFQQLFNGNVFTTTDNSTDLDSYLVANIGFDYFFLYKTMPVKIGFKFNNIFNKYYENVAYRPMPNRNIQTTITFKF